MGKVREANFIEILYIYYISVNKNLRKIHVIIFIKNYGE